MLRKLVVFLFFPFILSLSAQEEKKSFTVKHIDVKINPDGVLDEEIWHIAESAHDFWQYFPADDIHAKHKTEIKMLYDDENLYVGITVYTIGRDYAIRSLRRDFRAGGADNITLLFDTFNDANNAFLFGSNPYGVRREGLVSGGGLNLNGFTVSWDVKWRGDSKIYEDKYTTEWAIPLTSFKFREGETKWRFNSYRFDTQTNENSTWMHIPQNQNIYGLTFMGDMIFEKPLGKSRTPFAIIPYINALTLEDRGNDENQNKLKFGGDSKISIGNSMNLDITVNPDFSQVEVDDQVTNLSRFEVSLPEKRQFFVDNNDLFGNFGGSRDANPFFSRRIGIAKDLDGNAIENPIVAGVRLSGKVTKDLRLGFLEIQTEKDEKNLIASNNNAMLALQQKVFSRSNLGFFFINRQNTSSFDTVPDNRDIIIENQIDLDSLTEAKAYNRVVGVDYNLISDDNVWNGKYYLHRSFQPNNPGKQISSGLFQSYNSLNHKIFTDWVYIGENFKSDLGFVRRTDIVKGVIGFERLYWPKKGYIQNHGFELFPIFIWSPENDFQNTDYNLMGNYQFRFRDFSGASVGYNQRYTYLFDDFELTGKEDAIALAGDTGYHYGNYTLQYQSDRRKTFAYELEQGYGSFFNGTRFSFGAEATLRFQPKMVVSLNLNYDNIKLPYPHSSADIWLVSPKIDITFSKNVFWSTLIQYSNQRDNLGINSRLQWRFAPLSDLFLVYTDNYYVDIFAPNSRSINLKLTYWLNI